MELGYWNIKGITEPIRWTILHLGLKVTEWNPSSDEEWKEKAKTLGPLASLPYLKDGDLVITEASRIPTSIPYYLIEKSGHMEFLGKTATDRVHVNMIEGILSNVRQLCLHIIDLPKGSDYKGEVDRVFNKEGVAYTQIKFISDMLKDRPYILGYISFADLMLVFTARFTGAMCYSLLGYSPYADFPNIVKLMLNVSNLPGIKERLDGAQKVPYLPEKDVHFKFLNFGEMIDLGMNPI